MVCSSDNDDVRVGGLLVDWEFHLDDVGVDFGVDEADADEEERGDRRKDSARVRAERGRFGGLRGMRVGGGCGGGAVDEEGRSGFVLEWTSRLAIALRFRG